MTSGAFTDVTLGYQLLWNAQRQLAGITLAVAPHEFSAFDATYFLETLVERWADTPLPLTLSAASSALLADLLDQTPAALARIEIPAALMQNPVIAQRAMRAQQRGLTLVWRGEPGEHLKPAHAHTFAQSVLNLSANDALLCLRLSLRRQNGSHTMRGTSSPIQAGQLYEGVASRALVAHCLDEQGAAGVLGWPLEEVLHGYRQERIQPAREAMVCLLSAIEADTSMDEIEQCLGEEPILAYRFLRYVNSAGLGLNHDITALKQGLMVLGLSRLTTWLLDQLPSANTDPNLRPIRNTMVLRAKFMAELLDAGQGMALKRELYLCGLLSQMDLLQGVPLHKVLHAIPLSERITDAIVSQNGPYWSYLEIASALETPHASYTRAICDTHGFAIEDVNNALLNALASLRPTHN